MEITTGLSDGLYFPNIISKQKFDNIYDLKIQYNNYRCYIDIDEFRILYNKNKKMFFNAIKELIFRGGCFIIDEKIADNKIIENFIFPKIIRIIEIEDINKAKTDIKVLEILRVNKVLKSIGINYILDLEGMPFESFEFIGVQKDDFLLLEKTLLNSGCSLKETELKYKFENSPLIFNNQSQIELHNNNKLLLNTENIVFDSNWYEDTINKFDLENMKEVEVDLTNKSVPINQYLKKLSLYCNQLVDMLENIEFFKDLLRIYDLDDFLIALNLNIKSRNKEILQQRINKETLNSIGSKYNLTRERVRQVSVKSEKIIIEKLIKNGFEEYYKNNNIIIAEETVMKYLLTTKYFEYDFFYDSTLELVYNRKAKKIFDNYLYILEFVSNNKITSIKKLESELSRSLNLSYLKLKGYFEKNNFIVTKDYIVKNPIKKSDLFLYIIKTFYTEEFLDLSTEEGFDNFIEKIILIGLDPNDLNIGKYSDKTIRKIVSVVERLDGEVLKLDTNKYIYFDSSLLPTNLINKIEGLLKLEISKYGFVLTKKLYKNFESELQQHNIGEGGLFYILKILLKEEYYFYGRSSSFIIFDLDQKPSGSHDLMIRIIEENGGKVNVSKLIDIMGVERYTVDSLVQENKAIMVGEEVVLYNKIHNKNNFDYNSNKLSKLYFNKLNEEGYISIKKLYEECIFDINLNEALKELGCNSLESFRSILSMVTGREIGNNLIVFKDEEDFNLVDLLFKISGYKEELFRKEIESILMNLGLSEVTSGLYIKSFLDKGLLIPIDVDRYTTPELLDIDDNVLADLDFFMNRYLDNKYISVQKLSQNFYKLPESPVGLWSIPFLAYLICRFYGYRQVEDFIFNYDIDPYILVPIKSDITYKKIIFYEMTNFKEYPIEKNLIEYLKSLGLIPLDSKTLYEKFYSKNIFTKDELGKISIVKGVEHNGD